MPTAASYGRTPRKLGRSDIQASTALGESIEIKFGTENDHSRADVV